MRLCLMYDTIDSIVDGIVTFTIVGSDSKAHWSGLYKSIGRWQIGYHVWGSQV